MANIMFSYYKKLMILSNCEFTIFNLFEWLLDEIISEVLWRETFKTESISK